MAEHVNYQRTSAVRMPITAMLWVISAAGWTMLLLTEQTARPRPIYYAAAIVAAMGACTRIAILTIRHNTTKLAEVLEEFGAVNAARADAATAAAFRNHACGPHLASDQEALTADAWGQDIHDDYGQQRAQGAGETANVVPIQRNRHRRTAS